MEIMKNVEREEKQRQGRRSQLTSADDVLKYMRGYLIGWGPRVSDPEKLAALFKVLSVETRVRIVQLLKQRSLCVNALAQRLDITPAAVSQHLRVLRSADLVTAQKRGYFVHYQVNAVTLDRWKALAEKLLETDAT